MSEKRAFALRENDRESFSSAGAAVAGTGESVVVEDLLPKGKDDKPDVHGAIIVDAGPKADALASIPVLKEVSVAEAKDANKSGQSARKGA